MSVLEVKNLSYVYNEGTPVKHDALKNVNIEIEKGDIIGIMGHTGSGKSTLVQHLNGLIKPTSGEILLNGKNIWKDFKNIKDVRFKVGLVFQYPEYQLFEETVYKDIAFGPKNMGLSEMEVQERVLEAAEIVGLDKEYFEKSPFDLSGGQKRRAAIAGILAMKPEVLVLDEPTAGLDPVGRDLILGRIKEYRDRNNATVIIVSHNMEDMAKFAEKIIVLNNGEVAIYDETEKVFSKKELLESCGLKAPQATIISNELRKRKIALDKNYYTVEALAEALIEIKNKGGLCK